jgi:hypothetical protein
MLVGGFFETTMLRNSPATGWSPGSYATLRILTLHQGSSIKVCIAASKSIVPLSGLHNLDQNQQRPLRALVALGRPLRFCFVSICFPRRQFSRFINHESGPFACSRYSLIRSGLRFPRHAAAHITSHHYHIHTYIYLST